MKSETRSYLLRLMFVTIGVGLGVYLVWRHGILTMTGLFFLKFIGQTWQMLVARIDVILIRLVGRQALKPVYALFGDGIVWKFVTIFIGKHASLILRTGLRRIIGVLRAFGKWWMYDVPFFAKVYMLGVISLIVYAAQAGVVYMPIFFLVPHLVSIVYKVLAPLLHEYATVLGIDKMLETLYQAYLGTQVGWNINNNKHVKKVRKAYRKRRGSLQKFLTDQSKRPIHTRLKRTKKNPRKARGKLTTSS